MIDIDYLCIFRRSDYSLLFELKNVGINKKTIEFDFLKVIPEFYLDFSKPHGGNEDKSSEINEVDENKAQIAGKEDSPSINPPNQDEKLIDSKQSEENQKGIGSDELSNNNSNSGEISENNDINTESIETEQECENDSVYSIPETIKFQSPDIYDEKEHYYYFVVAKECVLLCVTELYYPGFRKDLEKYLNSFECLFTAEKITQTAERLDVPEVYYNFCLIFANQIVEKFFVPHIPLELASCVDMTEMEYISYRNTELNKCYENISSAFKKFNSLVQNGEASKFPETSIDQFIKLCDGIVDISSIAYKLDMKLEDLKISLMYLWLHQDISLKMPIYSWYIFERTHKANAYLFDGSDEQKGLIEEFGGGKIVSLLSRFDRRLTLKIIQKKMNLNDFKLKLFINGLLDKGLVRLIPTCPKLKPISEDVIPLLVIQGLSQDDISIIEVMQKKFDGTRNITDVASDMGYSGEKIKGILDLISDYVEYSI